MDFKRGMVGLLASVALISPFMNEGFAEEAKKSSYAIFSRKFEGKLPVNKIYREVYDRFEGKSGVIKLRSYDCFITAEKESLKLYLVSMNSKGDTTDILFRDEGLDGLLEEHWIDGTSKKTPEQKAIAESFYKIIVEEIIDY